MDTFVNGLHCVYDHARHTFIPLDNVDHNSPCGWVAYGIATSEQRAISDNLALGTSVPAAEQGTASPEHIRRPRNAFMVFRTEFLAEKRINRDVEHDNRHISRIAGHVWNKMDDEQKKIWQYKADQEKMAHMRKYPNYKYSPIARSKKPVKRKVTGNSDDELSRCRRVADLLLEGKQGNELAIAVKTSDLKTSMSPTSWEEEYGSCKPNKPSEVLDETLSSPEAVTPMDYDFMQYQAARPPTCWSSPLISPMSPEFAASCYVMDHLSYTESPPAPCLLSPCIPEAINVFSDGSTYRSYHAPDQILSPNYPQPALYVQSPSDSHNMPFEHFNLSHVLLQADHDTPYCAPNEVSGRHRPSHVTQKSSYHPYDGTSPHMNSMLDPYVNTPFAAYSL